MMEQVRTVLLVVAYKVPSISMFPNTVIEPPLSFKSVPNTPSIAMLFEMAPVVIPFNVFPALTITSKYELEALLYKTVPEDELQNKKIFMLMVKVEFNVGLREVAFWIRAA